MQKRFKDWLIADAKKMKPEQIQAFLQLVKFAPDEVVQIAASHIPDDWAMNFAFQTGVPLQIFAPLEDARELLEAYRENFAKELAAIPDTAAIPAPVAKG